MFSHAQLCVSGYMILMIHCLISCLTFVIHDRVQADILVSLFTWYLHSFSMEG